MPNLVICGPYGGGKGTLLDSLAPMYGLQKLATGEEVRKRVVAGLIPDKEKPLLVKRMLSDEYIEQIIREEWDGETPLALDGYPRTTAQVFYFLEKFKDFFGLRVLMSERLARKRLDNRLVCAPCGRTYSLLLPDGIKEVSGGYESVDCGHLLTRRKDDAEPERLENALWNYRVLASPAQIRLAVEIPTATIYVKDHHSPEEVLSMAVEGLKRIGFR